MGLYSYCVTLILGWDTETYTIDIGYTVYKYKFITR